LRRRPWKEYIKLGLNRTEKRQTKTRPSKNSFEGRLRRRRLVLKQWNVEGLEYIQKYMDSDTDIVLLRKEWLIQWTCQVSRPSFLPLKEIKDVQVKGSKSRDGSFSQRKHWNHGVVLI